MLAATVWLAGVVSVPAFAAPSTAQTAADRAAVKRASEQYEAARSRAAKTNARMSEVSAELDRIIAEETSARARLSERVLTMYRADEADIVTMLLSAPTMQEFMARWDMLQRMAISDAEALLTLRRSRAEAEKAAEELLELQAEQARAVDALASEVARAKKELATSEAALQEYKAKLAASSKSAGSAGAGSSAPSDPTQQLTGTGEWLTAVASHYGRNFSGRGASGEAIGPYSMIVAHKTLAFGTLIEFEYKGKRAVARVVDRGPYTPGREFDLGPGVVRVLGFSGVHEVRYRIIR